MIKTCNALQHVRFPNSSLTLFQHVTVLFYTYYYMETISIIKWSLYMFIFLAGLYFYTNSVSDHSNLTEGMQTKGGSPRCPNVLIQKGTNYYLFNSNLAQVPGVNPISLNNLEEYTEFLEWQRGA